VLQNPHDAHFFKTLAQILGIYPWSSAQTIRRALLAQRRQVSLFLYRDRKKKAALMRVNRFLASTMLTTSAAFAMDAALAQTPRPSYSWTGCYVGLNAGAMIGGIDQSVTIPAPVNRFFSSNETDTGFTGGGQAGCNWQHPQNWVFGIEGDINYADVKRSHNFAFSFNGEDTVGSQETKLRWLSTIRGRLGYAWNQSFLYATGGLALGEVKSSVAATETPSLARFAGSYSDIRAGWTAGAGYEHAFTNRISAKIEYLHFDLGEANYNVVRVFGASGLPPTWPAKAKVDGDIVRVGVNFKLTP